MKVKYLIIGIIPVALLAGGGYLLYWKPKPTATATKTMQTDEVTKTDCSVSDEAVIEAVNKEREKIGVKALMFSEALDNFASQRVLVMNGALDNHSGFYGTTHNLGYSFVGEDQNLMIGPEGTCWSGETWIKNFKFSEKHWNSLMNPRYDEIGVGYYKKVLNINLGDK